MVIPKISHAVIITYLKYLIIIFIVNVVLTFSTVLKILN